MGTGVFLSIAFFVAGMQPLFARDISCEATLSRPSFESVRQNLRRKHPVVFRRMLKADHGIAGATHQFDGSRHVFRFAEDMHMFSQTDQLSTLLHETVHMATANHFEDPKSDVVVARGIEIVDTSFEVYEEMYGFDELEARIREMTVLTQAAENYRTTTWRATDMGDDVRRHLVYQRLVIRKTLEWIDAGETSIEIGTNFIGLEIKNCKRRTFCKMELPLRGDVNTNEQAYDYIRRILAVRSNSLDLHLEKTRSLLKRLDALENPA